MLRLILKKEYPMNFAIATVKSLTYAQKAKRLLGKRGIHSKLIKLSDEQSLGCTYGIEFDKNHYLEVISILKENGIKYGTVKYEGNL